MAILAFIKPARIASKRKTQGRSGSRRPSPGRRRTFRAQNYKATPATKAWAPPAPMPLPPAPLLKPLEVGAVLLASGAAALFRWAWGRLNQKAPGPTSWPMPIEGDYTLNGSTRFYGTGPAQVWSAVGCKVENLDLTGFTAGTVSGTFRAWEVFEVVVPGCFGVDVKARGIKSDGTYFEQYILKSGNGKGFIDYGLRSQVITGVGVSVPKHPPPQRTEWISIPTREDPFAPLDMEAPLPPLPAFIPGELIPLTPVVNPVPVSPGPAAAPARPALPQAGPRPVLAPIGAPVVDGVVAAPKPVPVPITDPDTVFPIPGQPGVPGNGPQPNLPEMAKELGRIERKLEAILNPQGDGNPTADWMDRIDDFRDNWDWLYELLTSLGSGGEYTLREPCDPDGDGVFNERRVPYAGALGPMGVLSNKIDALAELMQAAKDLRQPVCPPPAQTGEGVTVHFASLLTPPGDNKKLPKLFRYRDQSGAPLEMHHVHWKDFTWTSGPVLVKSTGMPWGKPQVWAVSAEEGKRVLAHAAAVAGVNLSDPRHRWDIRRVSAPRYGRSEPMEVKRLNLGLRAITKRPGPDGPLWVVAD